MHRIPARHLLGPHVPTEARVLHSEPIFQLDLVGPACDILRADLGQGGFDLGVVRGQELVDLQALEHRVGDEGQLVLGPDLRIDEMPGRVEAGLDAARGVEGEIEEDDELATQGRGFFCCGSRGKGGRRLEILCDSCGRFGQIVPLEGRKADGTAVVRDREFLAAEVADGLSALVDHVDLDELQGHGDLILERRLLRRLLAASGQER
jgi:hypothetical protein